jgi:hypothetical protein
MAASVPTALSIPLESSLEFMCFIIYIAVNIVILSLLKMTKSADLVESILNIPVYEKKEVTISLGAYHIAYYSSPGIGNDLFCAGR